MLQNLPLYSINPWDTDVDSINTWDTDVDSINPWDTDVDSINPWDTDVDSINPWDTDVDCRYCVSISDTQLQVTENLNWIAQCSRD